MASDNVTGKSHQNGEQPAIIDTSNHMSMYLIGSVTGVFFILTLCVVVMLIKNRSKPLRPSELCLFNTHGDPFTCKSAPISRSHSPTSTKRGSCPNAYGTLEDLVMYTEALRTSPKSPKDCLTVEGAQPMSDGRSRSITTLAEYQNNSHSSSGHFIRSDSDPLSREISPGRLWFTVTYDLNTHELIVLLIQIRDLPGRSPDDNSRDPFSKVTLLPDEDDSQTSKIIRKSLNPVYNETFQFKVRAVDLESKVLRFSVYDVDKRRIRHPLGRVIVPLKDVDVTSSELMCKYLDYGIQSSPSIGEMNIGLVYLPHLDKVKVIVMKIRNVRLSESPHHGLLVRLECFYGKKLLKTKQTLMQRCGEETIFNESFSFNLAGRAIENFRFTLTLVMASRKDVTSEDTELGHVDLGSFMYARGAGLIHWQEMLSKTRTVVNRWHPLSVPV